VDDDWLEAALEEQHPDEVWFSAAELVARTTVVLTVAAQGTPPAGATAAETSADPSAGGRPRGPRSEEGSFAARTTRGLMPHGTFAAPLGYFTPREASLLAALEQQGHLDWARLPTWPDGPVSGHGLGDALARNVGPLRPETRLWIDEAAALGAGQAMVWQLADGLALAAAAAHTAAARAKASHAVGTGEVGASEVGANEPGSSEIGPREIGSGARGQGLSDPPDRDAPGSPSAADLFVVLFSRHPPEDLAVAAIARHAGVDQGILHRGPIAARDSGRWSPFALGEGVVRARASAAALASSGRDAHLRWVCEGDAPFDPAQIVDAIATDVAEMTVRTGAAPWLVVCWDGLNDAFAIERAADLHSRLRAHPLLRRHATVAVSRGVAAAAAGAAAEGIGPAPVVRRDAGTHALARHFQASFSTRVELVWAGTRADEDARVRLLARVSVREPGRGQDVFAGEHPFAWWPAWSRVQPVEGSEP
jgi:hypothetical protein